MATIQVKIVDVSGQLPNPDSSLNEPIKNNLVELVDDVANEVTIQTSDAGSTLGKEYPHHGITTSQNQPVKHQESANSIPCKNVSTPFDDLHGQIASGHATWSTLSKDWKSTHIFTGNNFLFPVELFLAVMEQKYANKEDKSNLLADTLNRIPDPEQNSVDVLNMPSTLWKHQHLNSLLKVESWEELKNTLVKQFGRQERYSIRERAAFLQSIQRGQRERMDTYLVRLNIVVHIVQHGVAIFQPLKEGNDIWLKILLLAGLDEDSRNLLPKDIDALSLLEICDQLAKKNAKLYFEGQQLPHYSTKEYDNFFSWQPLGWNDEDAVQLGGDQWQYYEHTEIEESNDVTSTKENIYPDEEAESNVRQSKRLKLKRKTTASKVIGHQKAKKSKTTLNEKTEEELEDSKQKAHETNKFSCDKCGEIFDSVLKRNGHMVIHSRYKTCPYCLEELDGSWAQYMEHKKNVHGDGKVCEICNQSFEDPDELQKHQDDTHLGAQYKCKFCPAEMRYKTIKSHMDKIHNPNTVYDRKPWIRKNPRRKRVNPSEHNQMMARIARSAQVTQSLEEYAKFNKHINILEGQKPKEKTSDSSSDAKESKSEMERAFFCGLCKQNLLSYTHMKEHFDKEHEGKKFSCDKCDYTCKRLDILAKHRFANHKLGSQGYDIINCTIEGCSYQAVFKDKMARHKLAKHEIESEGYQTLLCPQPGCNYKSTDPGYLQVHIEGVHEKLRTSFGSNSSTKTRVGKLFNCGVCDKALKTEQGYKLHMETVHMGLKKYKCNQCKKCYTTNLALDKHKRRIHATGEVKKHVCHLCGMETVHYANFKRHLVQVHGEPGPKCLQLVKSEEPENENNLCPCPTCGRMFHSEIKRNAHMLCHTRWKTCPICFISIGGEGSNGSWDAYKEHKEKYHGNGKICEICNALFDQVDELKKHQEDFHQGAQYKCRLCPKEMKYKAIKQHMEKDHKDAVY